MAKSEADGMEGWGLLRETDKYIIEGRSDNINNKFLIKYTKIDGGEAIETNATSPAGYKELLKTFEKSSPEAVNLLADTVYLAKSFDLDDDKIGVGSEAEVVG